MQQISLQDLQRLTSNHEMFLRLVACMAHVLGGEVRIPEDVVEGVPDRWEVEVSREKAKPKNGDESEHLDVVVRLKDKEKESPILMPNKKVVIPNG